MIEIQFSSRAKLTGHCVGNTGLDVGEYGMEADVETLAAHPSISTVIIIHHIRDGGTYAWNPYQTGNVSRIPQRYIKFTSTKTQHDTVQDHKPRAVDAPYVSICDRESQMMEHSCLC